MNSAVRIDFLIYPHHKMNSIGLISLCSFRMRWKTKKIQIYTTSICGCLCIRKRDLLFFLHDCLCTLGDRCVKQAKTFYWDTKQTYKRKCSITFMRDLNRHDWMDDFVQTQTIAKQTQRDLFKRPLFYLLLFSQIAHMDYKFILCIQHL